jgi:hypothetical protein
MPLLMSHSRRNRAANVLVVCCIWQKHVRACMFISNSFLKYHMQPDVDTGAQRCTQHNGKGLVSQPQHT